MRRFPIFELFTNPEYRVELSVVLFLLIGLSITILMHQITLGGVENLLESDMQSTQKYDLNVEELQALEEDLVRMESDLKAYVATGNPVLESAVRNQLNAIRNRLGKIRSYLSPDADEIRKYNAINELLQQKLNLVNTILRRYQEQKPDNFIRMLDSTWISSIKDSVALFSDQLIALQQNTIKENIQSHQEFVYNSRRVELVTTVIVFAIVSISILYLLRETSKRLQLQEKLASAKEEAELNARIKEQFMANMSHEIRTPLNAIVGFTNLLKNTPLNERQEEYVASMRYSGENLLAIVNDILDLSKMEAGMMKLDEAPFDLNEVLHSLESLFRFRAEEKGIDFQVNISPEIPNHLIGDPNRLMQILGNLLNNAIKFTEQGKVVLRATKMEQEIADIALLRIEVEDTGIGIHQTQLHRIFERFNQVYTGSTRKYGGAGLGLTIVKRLVELLDGTINVESVFGEGTTFAVELPYQIAAEHADQIVLPAVTSIDKSHFRGASILMVEDNPMNRRVIELLLESWHLQLDQAENGNQALELVRHKNYDLILMDIQMPELDGYQTTRAIRNKWKLKMPIIAMTAHALPGEREKCLRYGMNDYLSKPLRDKELFQVLTRFLPQKNGNMFDLKLNLAYLEEVSQGDPSYRQELAQIFVEHLPKELAALQQAFAEGNTGKVRKVAHSMRSTVGYIGLSESLGALLRELEEQASANEMKALIEEIQTQCAAALDLVNAQILHLK